MTSISPQRQDPLCDDALPFLPFLDRDLHFLSLELAWITTLLISFRKEWGFPFHNRPIKPDDGWSSYMGEAHQSNSMEQKQKGREREGENLTRGEVNRQICISTVVFHWFEMPWPRKLIIDTIRSHDLGSSSTRSDHVTLEARLTRSDLMASETIRHDPILWPLEAHWCDPMLWPLEAHLCDLILWP